jgi:hypothetical protein
MEEDLPICLTHDIRSVLEKLTRKASVVGERRELPDGGKRPAVGRSSSAPLVASATGRWTRAEKISDEEEKDYSRSTILEKRGWGGPADFGGSVGPRFLENIPYSWIKLSTSIVTKHQEKRDHPIPSHVWSATKHTLSVAGNMYVNELESTIFLSLWLIIVSDHISIRLTQIKMLSYSL